MKRISHLKTTLPWFSVALVWFVIIIEIKKYLKGGQCLSYGARALNSQGYFSIPELVFPGGVLAGCSAGFMNVMKIKGSHNAIKSGLEAGKAIYNKLTKTEQNNEHPKRVDKYEAEMKRSWVF